MIESIRISRIGTFGNDSVPLNDLSQFNFFFGANGTGKTTISRIIADEKSFPTCAVKWRGGTKLQAMVYNRDFVARNFSQLTELKGIFTLGEKNIDTIKTITDAKTECDKITKTIESLTHTLQGDDAVSGKKGELTTLESEFKDKCWKQKQKYDQKFSVAFESYRSNADKFKSKVLEEKARNSAKLEPLKNLEKKAETVFVPTPTVEKTTPTFDSDAVISHESNPILMKQVIGKADVDISAMIQKLSNSDWVKEGRTFYKANNNQCPFCQKSTPDAFAQSLEEYFDDTFEEDSKAIEELETSYKTDAEELQQMLGSIVAAPSKFLDVEKLKSKRALLDSKITDNIQRLATKRKEPSQKIELASLTNVVTDINELIQETNTQISGHNEIVENFPDEKRDLIAQVWKYILEDELKLDLQCYEAKKNDLNKAIDSLNEQIASAKRDKKQKEAKIDALERDITSIQPTISGINALLASFGFLGFSLAKADNGRCYKVVRTDGTDAKETLSEGEKNFVTFLYFYHLLKGSDSESGIMTDRVVVFDDPVSSLDSDILFLVGSLIKGLFDEVRSGEGYIKQIFLLTHNVYFHKEVAFNPKRGAQAMKEETFWIIRKPNMESKVLKHDSNPIKTSYELLWDEVRRSDRSNLTIQNTLRRILENYFKILGGIDSDNICEKFEGKEKIVCRSLFSWVNVGSHDAFDDLYLSIDDSMVTNYLSVFKAIFEKSGHEAHYRMMMGDTLPRGNTEPITC